MTENIQNRRAFFRINDTLDLQVRPLENAAENDLKTLHRQRCALCDEANEKQQEKLERPSSMALVGRRYPEVLAYVKALEKRAEEARQAYNDGVFGDGETQRQLVNISGNGIRFTSDTPYPPESKVELILRLENGFRFVVFADVLRATEFEHENGETGWSIAAHFSHIREDDQDELLRFLLSRQMESVRVASS